MTSTTTQDHQENREETLSTPPENVKLCLECRQPMKPGREDRKFCDDGCRTLHNNRRRREQTKQKAAQLLASQPELSATDYMQKIVDILKRNHMILEKIGTGAAEPVKMEARDLMGRGFNFKFFTSEAPTQSGNIYRFCFDRGYMQTPDGFVIIVQREREVIC